MVVAEFDEGFADGGVVAAVKACEAKLPVYLCAFYPHGYESALLYLFARGLKGRYAYAHVLFDHALDGGKAAEFHHDCRVHASSREEMVYQATRVAAALAKD